MRPWGFDLRDIRMRVHLWQGEADTNVPPSMGRYLASVIPDCVPHFYPREGHLLVVDRVGEILDTIAPSPQPDRQPAASEPSKARSSTSTQTGPRYPTSVRTEKNFPQSTSPSPGSFGVCYSSG